MPDGGGDVQVIEPVSGARVTVIPGDGQAVAKHASFVDDHGLVVTWPGRNLVAEASWAHGLHITPRATGLNYRRVVAAGGALYAAGYGASVFRLDREDAPWSTRDGGSPIDLIAADGAIAWLSSRGGVEVVDVATGQRETRASVPGATRIALAGDTLAIARPDRIQVLRGDDPMTALTVEAPGVAEVALSADGAWLAAGTMHGEVWLWDVSAKAAERLPSDAAGVLRMTGVGHDERVSGVAFGPAGDWLVSAGWDGVVVRWDLRALATDAAALVMRFEHDWGVGLDHAVRADVR